MNKITCNVIKDILPLYIDGVVSEDTQKIVEEHLEECSLCRDEINKLKKTLVIPTNEEIQQGTVNILEKSISSIERTIVKKIIHYSSYFDLIFNIGMIPFVYWLYVVWIKKETSLLNIYVFVKKYGRMSGDLLSFALFFVIFICCDIIHIILTMKKKYLNIMDSVVVMSIMMGVGESGDCSFYIEDKQVVQITYRTEPVYNFYPMDDIPPTQDLYLKGFKWEV